MEVVGNQRQKSYLMKLTRTLRLLKRISRVRLEVEMMIQVREAR